jgi:hypothetical protein
MLCLLNTVVEVSGRIIPKQLCHLYVRIVLKSWSLISLGPTAYQGLYRDSFTFLSLPYFI